MEKENMLSELKKYIQEEKFIKILEGAYYDEIKPIGRKQNKKIAKSAGAKKEYGF